MLRVSDLRCRWGSTAPLQRLRTSGAARANTQRAVLANGTHTQALDPGLWTRYPEEWQSVPA